MCRCVPRKRFGVTRDTAEDKYEFQIREFEEGVISLIYREPGGKHGCWEDVSEIQMTTTDAKWLASYLAEMAAWIEER